MGQVVQPGLAAVGGRARGPAVRRFTSRRERLLNLRTWFQPDSRGFSGRVCLAACCLVVGVSVAAEDSVVVLHDPVGDATVRRMDAGADGPVDVSAHHQPDIVSCAISRWQPALPNRDRFTGTAAHSGEFFRLDLIFKGLVNPPGPSGCCGLPFAPFEYGPHPVFGYVEIDVDGSADTGGELDAPQLRYLGNAARFGGLPADPVLKGRVARDATAFDSNVTTPPLVDRSGEEFHVSLDGSEILTIVSQSDSADRIFGPGETWIVTGRLFPRAGGYEKFSLADTGGVPGRYSPVVQIRFAHSLAADRTVVSVVYPLTNAGSAALMNATVIEPLDGNAGNQNSVLEGLDDLVFSAINAPPFQRSDPDFVIIEPWGLVDLWPGANDATRFLDPLHWRITILAAGSYSAANSDAQFVWSDVLPDVHPGDFNGDAKIDWRDRLLLTRFITSRDGLAGLDKDGQLDCAVGILNFGPNFSVFDVNYDGRVEDADLPVISLPAAVPGDLDGDLDVDQTDFGILQACFGGLADLSASSRCEAADLDLDRDVDHDDLAALQSCASGPAVRADPACWPPEPLACLSPEPDLTDGPRAAPAPVH